MVIKLPILFTAIKFIKFLIKPIKLIELIKFLIKLTKLIKFLIKLIKLTKLTKLIKLLILFILFVLPILFLPARLLILLILTNPYVTLILHYFYSGQFLFIIPVSITSLVVTGFQLIILVSISIQVNSIFFLKLFCWHS